jgi:hypothetical protein
MDRRLRDVAGRFMRRPRRPQENLDGRKFGRLTVVCHVGYKQVKNGTHRIFKCRCECGRPLLTTGHRLRSGNTQSCGCRKLELLLTRNQKRATHRHTANQRVAQGSTPEYRSWQAMKGRCLNPNNSSYADYGQRGVRVCPHWLGSKGFINFLADMGLRPKGRTLSRLADSGNYYKSNCRWHTRKQQVAEQRRNRARRFATQP